MNGVALNGLVASGAGGSGLFILILVFAVMWFALIRSQKARQQRAKDLLQSVEPGDEVLTVGGLYGIVQSIDEEGDLIVEIADGIHVRLARRSVATVVKPDEEDEGGEHEEGADSGRKPSPEEASAEPPVTVPDDEAGLEATQRRLFGRRRN